MHGLDSRHGYAMLPIPSAMIIAVSLPVTGTGLALPLDDILRCLFWGGCLSGLVNWTFIIASYHLATAEPTLLILIEFALGPLWVWLFVDEVPHRWTLIGGSVIIVSVAVRTIVELLNRPRSEQTPGQPVQVPGSIRGGEYLERAARGAPIPCPWMKAALCPRNAARRGSNSPHKTVDKGLFRAQDSACQPAKLAPSQGNLLVFG